MKTTLKYLLISLVICLVIVPITLLDSKALVVLPNQLKPESLSLAQTLVKNIHKKLAASTNNHFFTINIW